MSRKQTILSTDSPKEAVQEALFNFIHGDDDEDDEVESDDSEQLTLFGDDQ